MTNYIFNGMNAQKIANKVIAKEEAYNNADITLMPFEEKCYYALEQTPIIHPAVSPNRNCRRTLFEELRPELLRRAKQDDPFALYVLGNINADLSARPTDEERIFLERAMNAGYISAAFSLFNLFYYFGKKRSCPEAEHIISWLSERIDENSHARERYCYYSLVNDKDKEMELALDFALDGDYCSVIRLANAFDLGSDERVFWQTVHFLITEYFYDKGATHLGDSLGMKLINERGCNRDLEKIKAIYVDLMMNYEYDRNQLASIVGITCNDIDEAERVCRSLIQNGKKSNYWRLILIAFLSGDRKKVEAVCDEVIKHDDGMLVVYIAKAYHMLRHAGKRK